MNKVLNFLAHIYLSGEDQAIRTGNFIADAIRGNQLASYPLLVQKGIRLHRAIDAFTDQHPIVLQSTERLRESQKKYAPVVVDIFYDHFLAKNWQNYHQEDLYSYTQRFYEGIRQETHLPSKIQHLLPYMIRQNWLYNYRKISAIKQVFAGMSKRTSFPSNLLEAPKMLEEYYEDFQQDFEAFFPEIILYVMDWLATD
ncbi:MAG: acyl carrier protein phosphodiesterase [Raineya sp.]